MKSKTQPAVQESPAMKSYFRVSSRGVAAAISAERSPTCATRRPRRRRYALVFSPFSSCARCSRWTNGDGSFKVVDASIGGVAGAAPHAAVVAASIGGLAGSPECGRSRGWLDSRGRRDDGGGLDMGASGAVDGGGSTRCTIFSL